MSNVQILISNIDVTQVHVSTTDKSTDVQPGPPVPFSLPANSTLQLVFSEQNEATKIEISQLSSGDAIASSANSSAELQAVVEASSLLELLLPRDRKVLVRATNSIRWDLKVTTLPDQGVGGVKCGEVIIIPPA